MKDNFINVSDIVQEGSYQELSVAGHGATFTEAQTYCLVGGVVLIVFLVFAYVLIKTYILKSCSGCKRLLQCEKDIADLKTTNKLTKEIVEALRGLKK